METKHPVVKVSHITRLGETVALSLESTEMVTVQASHYGFTPGGKTGVALFNMTRADLYELAKQIMEAANNLGEPPYTFGG
jgi:hypothetical protein